MFVCSSSGQLIESVTLLSFDYEMKYAPTYQGNFMFLTTL